MVTEQKLSRHPGAPRNHLFPTMAGIRHRAQSKLTLKKAVHYALIVLDAVTPSLMRPAAAHNIAAIMQCRYKDVRLPHLDEVRQLVLQEESMLVTEHRALQKLTLKIAVRYVMNLLTLVAPELMRSFAAHNIAAIQRCHYKDVRLPDHDDVRQLILQRVFQRP